MKFLLPLLGLHCTDRLLLRDRQCFSGFRTLLTFTLFPTFSSWAPTRVLLPGSLVPIEVDQVWCGSNGKLYVLPSENGEVTQAPRRGRAAPAPAQSHSSRSRGRGRGAGPGAGPGGGARCHHVELSVLRSREFSTHGSQAEVSTHRFCFGNI